MGAAGPGQMGGGPVLAWILLCLAESPAHGYQLLERLGREAGLAGPLLPGTLYRWLRGLEQRGLVVSRWEAGAAGPARRRYALTAGGWQLLDEVAARLEEERRHLDRLLARYRRLQAERAAGVRHAPDGEGPEPGADMPDGQPEAEPRG